jgi:hypothetical protein
VFGAASLIAPSAQSGTVCFIPASYPPHGRANLSRAYAAGMRVRPTLQNRVTPTGEIVADPARGLLMGNRGCLHGPERVLGTARWRSKLWITCVLRWKDIRRDPMPPGRWTALFFLDEATALAAGHRPCAYCRRQDFLAYAHSWASAGGMPAGERPRAAQMDAVLHRERVYPRSRRQVTRTVPVAGLPDGVMVRLADSPDSPDSPDGIALLAGGALRPWSFTGYGPPVRPPATVELLTPPTTVATIAAGYRPWVHPSAAVPERRPPDLRFLALEPRMRLDSPADL